MKFKLLREQLLHDGQIEFYKEIVELMQNPFGMLSVECKQYLEQSETPDVEAYIKALAKDSKDAYKLNVTFGQLVMWEKYLNAYLELMAIKKELSSVEVVYYEDNYLKSNEQILNFMTVFAKAKAVISKIESELSVDRYLDTIAESDFEFLVNIFDEIHRKTEEKLEAYKCLYTSKWNSGNICEIMLHKLVRSNMDNQVCSLFPSKRKHTFLFIIDGLGLGQYLWSKEVVPSNQNFVYSENVFKWLAKSNLSEEYILGAPLVTDTAAGICQIYTGKTSKETRVFSSTVKRYDRPTFISVKEEPEISFKEIANTDNLSFTVDISSECEQMKIYYCSKYDRNRISGFSKYLFDGADVISVVPPERVFSILREDCRNLQTGATVVYITSIDNSGHVMGSFSQFERYEHEKLNSLIRNFLIELAKEQPELFDGATSILLTADHGMTESYRINISRKDIMDELHRNHKHAERLIEANRAMFLYGVTGSIEESKVILQSYFKNRNIDVLILSKEDELFKNFMPSEDADYIDTTPDIVTFLISEGIFYSKDVGENLMHFGGHGGRSIDEVFVPAIEIELNQKLLEAIESRFLKFE